MRKMKGGQSYTPIAFEKLNMDTDYYIQKDNNYINIGKYISNGFKDKVFFSKIPNSINMENITVYFNTNHVSPKKLKIKTPYEPSGFGFSSNNLTVGETYIIDKTKHKLYDVYDVETKNNKDYVSKIEERKSTNNTNSTNNTILGKFVSQKIIGEYPVQKHKVIFTDIKGKEFTIIVEFRTMFDLAPEPKGFFSRLFSSNPSSKKQSSKKKGSYTLNNSNDNGPRINITEVDASGWSKK
jgi:hypothetical protein